MPSLDRILRQAGPPPCGSPWQAALAESLAQARLPLDQIWELATGGPWPDPESLKGDDHFMALALRQALRGVGLASSNPAVGCVIVRDGLVIGAGCHLRAGGPHAEIVALADAAARGESLHGASVYLTLEPCCHHGRTPPCSEALLRAGVSRVVVGVLDPNPKVDGGGVAQLQAGGVRVGVGVLGQACADFHAPFFKTLATGLPWVVFFPAGGPGPAFVPEHRAPSSLEEVLGEARSALRRGADAIVIGRSHAATHDPRLRDSWPMPCASHRKLWRVVMDAQATLDRHRRVWAPGDGQPVLRATLHRAPPLDGVEDIHPGSGPFGLDMVSLLRSLAARGAVRMLFEGGPNLARSLAAQNLLDEFHRIPLPGFIMGGGARIIQWPFSQPLPWV